MTRIHWFIIFILAPFCCCAGQFIVDRSAPRWPQERIVRLPTFTPTPTPTPGQSGGDGTATASKTGPAAETDNTTPTRAGATSLPPVPTPPATRLPSPTVILAPSPTPAPPTPTLPPPVTVTPAPSETPPSTPTLPPPVTATPAPSETPLPTSQPTATPTDDEPEPPDPPTATPTPVPPIVRFSAAAYPPVSENAGSALITVIRSPTSPLTTTVAYAAADGTALAGSDYQAVNDVLTFAPGQTNQNFNVPIIDDTLTNEFTETLFLTLANPVNGILGSPETAGLTIVDNDAQPTVQFSRAVYTAAEIDGGAPITVALSAPSALTVTVTLTTAGGSALAGDDYAPISGRTLTFPAGQTNLSFTVIVTPDLISECDEDLILTLGNPAQAVLGPLLTSTLTIISDDLAPADDAIADDCNCTLREAIITANTGAAIDAACPVTNNLTLNPVVYSLTLPGAGEDNAATGDLDITTDLTISGAGAGTTIIDAGLLGDRVFDIITGTVTMSGLTIRNGAIIGFNAHPYDGGGVLNRGTLTLTGVKVVSNTASFHGGGLENYGTMTLIASTVAGNTANYSGGGIYQEALGTMTLIASTVAGNTANSFGGGGLENRGTMTLRSSTVAGNRANSFSGGGVYNIGAMTLMASTIAGNTANVSGGGVYQEDSGTMTLMASTVAGNTANVSGGGVYQEVSGTMILSNTIVANNVAGGSGGDCNGGTMTSNGYNLSGDTSCDAYFTQPTDITNTDPLLGPLQNYGGPTETQALSSGSPAIDQIPAGVNGCGTTFTTDQRGSGFGRPINGLCDIGAFEVQ